jgi:sugar phosphate permease
VTMWYKKSEQPSRMSWWYQGVAFGPAISALASLGLTYYTGDRFYSWQVLFLVFGLITILFGILLFFYLPDNPMHASFLTHDEKIFVIERLRNNQTGIENKRFKWRQALESLRDPQIWLMILMVISSNVPNAAAASFGNIIIEK